MLFFRVLGPLDVQRVEGEAERLSLTRPLERRLLAVLLANPRRVLALDELIEALWPADRPANPERALQSSISRLRKILGETGPGSIIAHKASGYLLDVGIAQVDATQFEQLLDNAVGQPAAVKIETIGAALEMWRTADAYSDFRFEDFARTEADRLEDLRLGALEGLIEARLANGETDRLIPEVEVLIKEHPLREGLYHALMLALYRAGRQAEALRTFQAARTFLGSELGIEPGRDLAALEEQILLQDPQLDIPERAQVRPNNIPSRVGPLIGRAEDLAIAQTRLTEGRLLTITGPGGVGKTTVALEAARGSADHYEHGAWLVGLESVQHPSQVAEAIGLALRRPVKGAGSTPDEVLTTLTAHLSGAELLLVIDNCEHLIDEAARVIRRILESCPAVSVLATSRERLMVPGELVLPLAPLTIGSRPPVRFTAEEAVSRSPALHLLADRCKAIEPSFAITDANLEVALRICRRLDGLPLAIELAAAQIGTLSLAEIEQQLSNRFELLRTERATTERHRTLAGAIEWSCHMLEPADRRLLQQLATIRTPFNAQIAAQLVGMEQENTMLAALSRLRTKSMIQIDRSAAPETRYELLRSIRAFAREKAEEDGVAADDSRLHASAFLSLSRKAYPRTLGGRSQIRWLSAVSRAGADFETAIETFLSNGQVDEALELCANIGWVWFVYRRQEEGYRVARNVLTAGAVTPSRSLARVHTIAASLLMTEGIDADPGSPRNAAILEHLNAARTISHEIEDPDTLIEATVWEGYHHWFMGDPATTIEVLSPVRDEAITRGYDRALMFACLAIGGSLNLQGDRRGALEQIHRSLGEAHTARDGLMQSLGYSVLGSVLRDGGEFGAAAVAYHSGYLIAARYGFPMYSVICAGGEAMTRWLDGQDDAAIEAAERAIVLATGRPPSEAYRSFQNVMTDAKIDMSPRELSRHLTEIRGSSASDQPKGALRLLVDLFKRHAIRNDVPGNLELAEAALDRLR